MRLAQLPMSLFAAAGLIAGIVWQYAAFGSIHHVPYAVAASLFAPLCWHVYSTPYSTTIRCLAVIILFFLLGTWRYSYQCAQIDAIWKSLEHTSRDLIGTVQDIAPTNIARQHLYRIQVTQQKSVSSSQWISTHFIIHIFSKPESHIQVGDTIELSQIRFQEQTHSEYSRYLAKEGVICSLFSNMAKCTVIHRPSLNFNRWLHTVRSTLFANIISKMSTQTATLFSSLFFGNTKVNRDQSTEWSQLFRTWGLSHYLARSGLHLALFVYIWLMLLRYIPCSFLFKQLLLAVLTSIYALLSWSSTSFYRAINTFALYVWCTLHKRRTNFLHILSLVCLATLLYNPSNLLFLDFELSYGLTLALGWFNCLDKNSTNGR